MPVSPFPLIGIQCEFETSDLCEFSILHLNSNSGWTWGSASSSQGGPDLDHTYGMGLIVLLYRKNILISIH